VSLTPASTTGKETIVNIISSLVVPHGVFPLTVKVRLILPLAISTGPGVYVAPERVASSNNPSPGDDHNTLAKLVPPPESVYEPSSQIVASDPATAVGKGVTVTVTDPVVELYVSSRVTVYVVVTIGLTIGFC